MWVALLSLFIVNLIEYLLDFGHIGEGYPLQILRSTIYSDRIVLCHR
jgi:hypothetical protein